MNVSARSDKAVIGVTGSYGSGKSTVSAMLADCGARVIDADRLSRRCLRRDHPAYRAICRRFGTRVLKSDGRINRNKLAQLVFSDARARRALNAIIHPHVLKMIREQITRAPDEVIVCDVPLLLETGLDRLVDIVVVVRADRDVQLRRLRRKSKEDVAKIRARIEAQMPLAEKERLADFIIDNSYSRLQTKKQVERLWKRMRHRKKNRVKRQ